MAAMTSVSLWFALVTVVPGLITIAAAWLAFIVVYGGNSSLLRSIGISDATLVLAIGVAVMVLTQTLGILLEERILIPRMLLGRGEHRRWERVLRHDLDPFQSDDVTECSEQRHSHTINPYDEYKALYLVLTSLTKDEDTHGHLQRVAAQLFLTLNSIVALLTGIAITFLLIVIAPERALEGLAYMTVLTLGVAALRLVAANRFALLGWGLWSIRQRRIKEEILAERKRARSARQAAVKDLSASAATAVRALLAAGVTALLANRRVRSEGRRLGLKPTTRT